MDYQTDKVSLTQTEQNSVDSMLMGFRGETAQLWEDYMISSYINETLFGKEQSGVDDKTFRGNLDGMKKVFDYMRTRVGLNSAPH